MTLYVHQLDLMTDDMPDEGMIFKTLIDQNTADSNDECMAWFYEHYDINDYAASFTEPIN